MLKKFLSVSPGVSTLRVFTSVGLPSKAWELSWVGTLLSACSSSCPSELTMVGSLESHCSGCQEPPESYARWSVGSRAGLGGCVCSRLSVLWGANGKDTSHSQATCAHPQAGHGWAELLTGCGNRSNHRHQAPAHLGQPAATSRT